MVLNLARAICRTEYNLWVAVSSVAIVTALSLFPVVPQTALKSRYRVNLSHREAKSFTFTKNKTFEYVSE